MTHTLAYYQQLLQTPFFCIFHIIFHPQKMISSLVTGVKIRNQLEKGPGAWHQPPFLRRSWRQGLSVQPGLS